MSKYIKCAALLLCVLSFQFVSDVRAEEILAWEDCLDEAKNNNPNLISAIENVNQQKAGKSITASSLYPQINSSAGSSKTKTTTNGDSIETESYSYGITGRQLLFDGFGTISDIQSASENVKASEYNYRFTSSEIRLNLRTAFINLLKAQELINVAEEIVKIRKENLELIKLRYQSGLEHKGALLTAEANLAEANFDLSQAKRDLELAQRQLTKEMGRDKFSPISAKGDFTICDAAKEKPDFEALVQNNPSLLEAVAKKNAASFNIKSTYADFYPQISGEIGASSRGSDWPPEDDEWNDEVNIGLSLTMPIFEGGLRIAQVSKAKAAYNAAEANERNTKNSIVYSLAKAWAELQDALETVDVQSKSLDAATERSKIAEAQYSTGFIDFDSWIIIENNLVSTKKTYLNVQANAMLAEASWIQAKGETLEYAQ